MIFFFEFQENDREGVRSQFQEEKIVSSRNFKNPETVSTSRNHVSKVEAEEAEETEEEQLPSRRPPCFDHDPLLHYPGYLLID